MDRDLVSHAVQVFLKKMKFFFKQLLPLFVKAVQIWYQKVMRKLPLHLRADLVQ